MSFSGNGLSTWFSPWAGLLIAVVAVLIFVGNPAVALLTGSAIAFALNRPIVAQAQAMGRVCLQTAIVLLGFRLSLETIWTLSADYSVLVGGYVLATLGLGLALAALIRVGKVSGQLVAAGTAICGGTAIASLSPVLGARPQEMAVPLGLIFLLNVIALVAFPLIGHWLDLSQLEFGLWSALAIHDTSSVVATAAIYGDQAEEIAATVKLGRTLWLLPLLVVASVMAGRGGAKVRVPFFILLFVGTAAVSSLVSLPDQFIVVASRVSKALLVVALFLIGTELTRTTIRAIRGRILWQAVLLWLTVTPLSLLAILALTG